MSMPNSALAKYYVFPATSQDWDAPCCNLGAIPEGALVMLPPDFPVEDLGKECMKKVARTLMTYGARVVDKNVGTPFGIYVELGTDFCAEELDPNTWDGGLAGPLEA